MFKAKALVILMVCAFREFDLFLSALLFLVCSLEDDSRSSKLMSGCYTKDWRSANTKLLQHSNKNC